MYTPRKPKHFRTFLRPKSKTTEGTTTLDVSFGRIKRIRARYYVYKTAIAIYGSQSHNQPELQWWEGKMAVLLEYSLPRKYRTHLFLLVGVPNRKDWLQVSSLTPTYRRRQSCSVRVSLSIWYQEPVFLKDCRIESEYLRCSFSDGENERIECFCGSMVACF